MKKLFLILFLISIYSFAQKQKILFNKNIKSEANFYAENNELFSDVFVIKFKEDVIRQNTMGNSIQEKINPNFKELTKLLSDFELQAGPIMLEKTFKNFDPTDMVKTNRRTGQSVQLKDLSKVYQIKLTNPVSVTDFLEKFKDIPGVEYAHQAITVVKNFSPNDPIYINPGQWNLNVIQAEDAWNITHGASNVSIGIIDEGIYFLHEDLAGQQSYSDNIITGGHGTWVAGVASARTNNNIGIASIGYNCKMNSINADSNSIANSIYIASLNSDIINMSFNTAAVVSYENLVEIGCDYPDKWKGSIMPYSYPEVADAIENAISMGVVCIASAGNASENLGYGPHPEVCDFWEIPVSVYPAAYPNVIAVSGTELNTQEEFVDEWNHGSFVDLSAPAKNIWTTNYPLGYMLVNGTSFSSPLVAGVIGLLFSLNPNLSLQQIQNYLINSNDKIDNLRYPYNNNGWNEFLGFGRINAYKVVKPPLAPTNISYINNNGHPKLSWNASPDWDIKKYEIYRDLGNGYIKIGEVDYNITYYDDFDLTIGNKNLNNAFYYIKSIDHTNQSSNPSASIRVKYDGLQKEDIFVDRLLVDYNLFQNYPNPFNPSTIIKFSIPQEEHVSLKIFNLLGQEVFTLIDEIKQAGLYSYDFNAKGLSSGIYVISMKAGSFIKNIKIIFEK